MRISNLRSPLFSLILIAVVCIATAARANDQTPPSHFAGKFQDDKIAVVIAVEGAGCNGIVVMGEKHFPLNGHVDDGTLRGIFISDGTKFDFVATLAGNELTLVTGGTTYVLKNANPLARGSGPVTTAPVAPVAPAAPVKPGDIVGKWSITGDLGGEKFTLTLGPKGDMEVESSNGNSSSGPTYAYADSVLTFDGGTTINKLSLAGKWKITWKDEDTFTTVDNQGKPLTLHRAK